MDKRPFLLLGTSRKANSFARQAREAGVGFLPRQGSSMTSESAQPVSSSRSGSVSKYNNENAIEAKIVLLGDSGTRANRFAHGDEYIIRGRKDVACPPLCKWAVLRGRN